tara:strand:+ start:746 stop:1279 length:534 start_codon:yes stop_codon:yes gene_type:complete
MNDTDSNCQELNDIRYKTMFITGGGINNNNITEVNNEKNISVILDNELIKNKSEPWSKLNKTAKISKLKDYIQVYTSTNKLNNEEKENLQKYLLSSLDRKRLTSLKDVQYDKEKGVIKNIPMLHFNTTTRKFTLKRSEKRTSTVKHLTQTNVKNKKITKTSKKDKKDKDKKTKKNSD